MIFPGAGLELLFNPRRSRPVSPPRNRHLAWLNSTETVTNEERGVPWVDFSRVWKGYQGWDCRANRRSIAIVPLDLHRPTRITYVIPACLAARHPHGLDKNAAYTVWMRNAVFSRRDVMSLTWKRKDSFRCLLYI